MKNKLYYFIKDNFENLMFSLPVVKNLFSFKANQQQIEYVLYQLQVTKEVLFSDDTDQYKLKNHHVSFYANPTQNSYFGPYHYTATLYKDHEQDYKLHVYFDENDKVTSVSLCHDGAEELSAVLVRMELKDTFVQFAIKQCASLLIQLRSLQEIMVQDHYVQYTNIERRLGELSTDMAGNHIEYKKQHSSAIKVLVWLDKFHVGNEYRKLLTLFIEREHKLVTLEYQSGSLSVTEEVDETYDDEDEDVIPNLNPDQKNQVLAQQVCKVKQVRDKFKNLEAQQYLEQVNIFTEYHFIASELFGIVSESDLKAQHEIASLINEANAIGVGLTERLLLSNQFDLVATKLINYLNYSAEKLIRAAVVTGNAKLLSFLLLHTSCNLDTLIIRAHLNPVAFCFENASRNPSLIECLVLLVRHNASTMIDASDGLPIAYHIMRTTKFSKVFLDNAELTILDTNFYRILMARVKLSLQLDVVDESKIQEGLKAIISLKNKINVGLDRKVLNKGLSLSKLIFDNMEPILELLDQDPEVIEAYRELSLLQGDLSKLLTSEFKKTYEAKLLKKFEQSEVFLKNLKDILKIANPTKDEILSHVNSLKEMTRLQLHLISLKGNARHQKVNKSKKQLLKEIKSTEDRLRPLLKKYHDFIEGDGLARIAESASSYSNVSKQLDGLYKMKNALELMKDSLKTVHDFSSMYMEAQSKGAFLSEALGSDMDEFLQDVPRSGLGNS